MDWRESMIDRLPFYWSGDNVESFLSVIAAGFDDAELGLDSIPKARRIKELEEGEDISQGVNLDSLGQNVGVTRDTAKFIDEKIDIRVEEENDEMFRRRILWNIDLQQSDGIVDHIKDLVARGLIMYRVRTGLGGMVYKDRPQPDKFVGDTDGLWVDIPPKWEFPKEVDLGEKEYVDSSDILIFPNKEPRLGMEAPDSYHGKFQNFTNFYAIGVPWTAMPWSDGENSLIWRSQDDFDRPFYNIFTSDDLDGDTLTVEHNLDFNYPSVSITDENNNYIDPNYVTIDGSQVNIGLSSYSVDGTWAVRLTGSGFKKEFASIDLNIDNELLVANPLDTTHPSVVIYDQHDQLREPTGVTYVDADNILVDLTGLSVSDIWTVGLIGGEDVVEYAKEFSQSDLGAREMEVIHGLGADSPGVLIVDSDGNEYPSATIEEINDDSIRVKFPNSSTVTDTWFIRVSSARAETPKDDQHGWDNSVWTGKEEDLHIEPLKTLIDLTRPAATDVQMYGYGGMIWESQDEFDNPNDPPQDRHHGWGARWDGDIEETEYAMEELDDFWVNY